MQNSQYYERKLRVVEVEADVMVEEVVEVVVVLV